MSELITASNIEKVVQKNKEISEEVSAQVDQLLSNDSLMKVASVPQLALQILRGYGLVQMPIEDKFLSGAIYVKNGKLVPVLNTALPRANQYFAAWHEIYHLMFDRVSFDHFIETDNTLEERKAEYFAASMLLNGVDRFFAGLSEMEFLSKVFCCMSAFQSPYKAVLVSLYEYADKTSDDEIKNQVTDVFDLQIEDMPHRFRSLGLDDSLVMPSNVINTSYLNEKIEENREANPELDYHEENAAFLRSVLKETELISGKGEK